MIWSSNKYKQKNADLSGQAWKQDNAMGLQPHTIRDLRLNRIYELGMNFRIQIYEIRSYKRTEFISGAQNAQ